MFPHLAALRLPEMKAPTLWYAPDKVNDEPGKKHRRSFFSHSLAQKRGGIAYCL